MKLLSAFKSFLSKMTFKTKSHAETRLLCGESGLKRRLSNFFRRPRRSAPPRRKPKLVRPPTEDPLLHWPFYRRQNPIRTTPRIFNRISKIRNYSCRHYSRKAILQAYRALPRNKKVEPMELPRNLRQRFFAKAFGWPEDELDLSSTQEFGHININEDLSQAIADLRDFEQRKKTQVDLESLFKLLNF
ncbi:hypothetical protein L596_029024 [Steinernema carpocapsae]|uniref:Uncharacterized protein n=1 Tax=Steinernema carpocapsae TaxID=34508 RepID=A0A4U5LTE3_STECR|nr:hypothetical protein L596_029024 [Steinernema carpocapsae]